MDSYIYNLCLYTLLGLYFLIFIFTSAYKIHLYSAYVILLNEFPWLSKQVVLELQEDGKLTTSDDPPVVFGCLDGSFIQQVCLKVISILNWHPMPNRYDL